MIIDQEPGKIFDELAIFNVKINECNGLDKEKNIKNFKNLSDQIKKQIGEKLYSEILESDEYIKLYDANLATFKKIQEVQKTTGLAKEVDLLNYARFLSKAELQKIYFNTDIKEVKIGY
jgi:hypothetical protein